MSTIKFPLASFRTSRIERRYTLNELVPPDPDDPESDWFIAAVQPPGGGWRVFVQNEHLTGWTRIVGAGNDDGGAS
jgi:hypothetical protein